MLKLLHLMILLHNILAFATCILCPSIAFLQITVHSENFNAGIGTWSAVNESDATDLWTPTTGFMQINGVGGTNDIDWLISPAINMDAQSNEYFMFDYNDAFSGSLIELYYSANYSGSGTLPDVSAATWTAIPLTLVDYATTSCITTMFQRHPALDIGSINGTNVHFAFRYTGLSAAAKEYKIDDIHIEASYYAGITPGIDCAPLKSELHSLIATQEVIRYTSSLYDVWDAILHTDRRLNDATSAIIVWDMFTDIPAGTGEFEFDHCANRDGGSCPSGEGVCYNREHTFARSWWGGGTTLADTQNTDMHHIYASDRAMNTFKNNYPPGVVTTASTTGTNGFKVGTNASYPCPGMNYFEPIDEFKGDYARTFFYIVTRYQHNMTAWAPINAAGDCFMDALAYPSIEPWALTLLLQWHAADPVSQKEIDHNNAVYAIQRNRNPYIDNPGWVNLVWGDEFGVPCSLIALSIDLSSFSATLERDQVVLDWTTLSEESNDYFVIQRTIDFETWDDVEITSGAGNSAEAISYSSHDYTPYAGQSFYRLKQVDFDGKFTYSETRSISFIDNGALNYYPNPFENQLTISGTIVSAGEIQVFDIIGRDCSDLIEFKRINDSEILLFTHRLETNIYVVKSAFGSYKITKR
jgi:endonuclease I